MMAMRRWIGLGLSLAPGALLLAVALVWLPASVTRANAPAMNRPGKPTTVSLTRGPYLQSVTTNSLIIVWETDLAADSRVDYGLTSSYGSSVTSPASVTHHAMVLGGLSPYTSYHYRVTSDGAALSPTGTFRTAAPVTQTTLSFVAFGDTRTNVADHQSVVNRIVALAPDVVLHTGDLVQTGSDATQWTTFFTVERDLLRQFTLFPAMGNHELDHANYFNAFHLPNNERWYSFDYGPAHFAVLQVDGYGSYTPGTPQYTWLENDLAASDQQWKIVVLHYPPYSSGPHGDDAYTPTLRAALPPLFVRHGVNLVFSGHDHHYERSVVTDVTYIVAGGGGAPLYDQTNLDDNPYSVYFSKTLHAVSVTINSAVLSAVAVRPDGVAFDPFTLTQVAQTAYRPIAGAGLYSFGSAGARVRFTDTGTLTGITVTVAYTYPTGQISAWPLPRTYVITPAGGGSWTAALGLRYTEAELAASDVLTESALSLYRYDTNTRQWQTYSSTVDTVNNLVTATSVISFSTWAIGGPGGVPTAVQLQGWQAPSKVDVLQRTVWILGALVCALACAGWILNHHFKPGDTP